MLTLSIHEQLPFGFRLSHHGSSQSLLPGNPVSTNTSRFTNQSNMMKYTTWWLFFQALTTTCSVALTQYEEPLWWPVIEATFDGEFNLQRCRKRTAMNNNQKRMGPPSNGERCARRPKTCFFGLQNCSNGVSYPETTCICNFRTWQCDPVQCPP